MKKLLTVLAGSALLAVAGCSGGGSTASGTPSTTAAPKPGDVVQASSFTPRLQSAMKGAKTMHLKMTVTTAGAQGLTGEGDVSAENGVAEHLTMKVGSMPMELILKSPAIYLKSAALPVGNKWIMAKEGGTDMLSKQLAPLFEQIKQMQPEQQVSNYAVADQKVVGQETVDGVATTHYTSSPTAAQIKKALAPALAAQLSDTDLKDLKVDLWVDAQNRPHKVVSSMTVKGQAVSTTVLLSKFGEPVTITTPPAAQTTTAPQ
ncbi:LppX_LprAFG lipoprotein [Oryzihumus sp.]|uniref:LppX_LprAFG lipoprotein n=1 Tax=Oryzihumus sp. TaxID=1968903 RepID=UPI002ED8DD75